MTRRRATWLALAAVAVAALVFVRLRFVRDPPRVRPMPVAAAAGKDAQGDLLPPFARTRLGSLRFRGAAHGIGWTDGGTALVACGADGVVRVFDGETGVVRREWVAHRGVVQAGGEDDDVADLARRLAHGQPITFVHDRPLAAAVSRDGTRIVTGGAASVKVWDVAKGREVAEWRAPTGSVDELAISDDGRVVAQGGSGRLDVRDAATGERVMRLRFLRDGGREQSVRSLSLSGDGRLVAYVARTLEVVEVATGLRVAGSSDETHTGTVALSPAGDVVTHSMEAKRTDDGWWRAPLVTRRLDAFDAPRESGALRANSWEPLAFSADGSRIAAGGSILQIVDAASGTLLRETDLRPSETGALAWSPDGRRIAALRDGGVTVWDAQTGEESTPAGSHPKPWTVDLSADGRMLATSPRPGVVDLFDTATGARLRSLGEAVTRPDSFRAVIEGDALVTWTVHGSEPVVVRSWRLDDGTPLATTRVGPWHLVSNGPVPTIARTPAPGKVEILDPRTGAVLLAVDAPDHVAYLVTRDLRHVIATGKRVDVWDTATGRLVAPGVLVGKHWGEWYVRAVSGDGRAMAFSDGAHVEVFEIATGRRLGSFDTPECDFPHALALSFDACLAAAGGDDGAVVLHDVATGDVVATLPGHRARPAWIAFSADGRTLVSAAETILVWDVVLATGR